jgi:hypothetical protein
MITAHYHSVYSGNIYDSRPIGTQNLKSLIDAIKHPDQKTIDLVKKIRSETNEALRNELKKQLNVYTPCVLSANRRTKSEIIEFSGLLALDFDKLESVEYAKEFKQYLFNQYNFLYAVWLSSSGKGVRAIARIPRSKSVEEFQQYFNGLAREAMMGYIGFDIAPKNAVLPLFQSYDPELLYRETAEAWTKKYIAPEPPPRELISIEIDDDDERYVCNIIRKSIDGVNDNGHPQLRGASFALGGYVGAGYIAENRALDLIERLIDGNNYLSKKSDVYKKTAQEMIKKGQSSPLYLKK